jgi:hypothetical protein
MSTLEEGTPAVEEETPTVVPTPTPRGTNTEKSNPHKCSYRSCKIKATKLKCGAKSCQKEVHVMCYQGLLMHKLKLDPLPGGKAVCTKKCYDKVLKESSGGAEDQEEGGRSGKWDSDGLNGPNDPHTSVKILLEWWMTEGNYSKFCGKKNEGIKKVQFASALAEKMSTETLSKRDAKSVLCKIQHIERTWRAAHSFATSETGAGIMESNGNAHFKDLLIKKCPYYYDLMDVMADRASSQPKCTSYDEDKEEEMDDDDDEVGERSSNPELSDMSSEEEEEEGKSVTTKKTNASGSTKRTSSGGKKRKSALMDDDAVAALTAGNKAAEQRMVELTRHNKVVEDVEKRRVALEEKREERETLKLNLEQNKFKTMAWQGKNDELNYKMNLITKYEEFCNVYNWSDPQILAFFPDMAQVINAKKQAPVFQEETQHTQLLTLTMSQLPTEDNNEMPRLGQTMEDVEEDDKNPGNNNSFSFLD